MTFFLGVGGGLWESNTAMKKKKKSERDSEMLLTF